jgi:hypothetical protein
MPIHDWTRVPAGVYHDFHQVWTIELRNRLNGGVLPEGYYAMADQRVSGPEPDEIALRLGGPGPTGGLAVATRPPRVKQAARGSAEAARDAMKADRIAIREEMGRVVAMIEVVFPGKKDRKSAVGAFVGKAVEFLRNGIHVLMIDPFPPGPHDPDGLARLIWDEWVGEPFPDRPPARPLTVAGFDAGEPPTCYAECLAVGDDWPEPPLFLAPGWYVEVPLEATYEASWGMTPRPIRQMVAPPEGGAGR